MDGQPPSGPASQALVTKGKRTSSMTLTGVRVSLDDVGAYTSPSSGGDSPVGTSNIGSGPGGRSILTTSGNSLPMLATHNASSPGSVAGPSPSSGSSSLPGSAASSSSAGASGNTGSGSPLFRSVSNVHSPLSSPREKSSGSEDSPRPRLRTEDSIRRTHSGDKFTRPEKKHRTFGVDLAKVLKRENSKIPFILELLVNHVNAQISKDGMTAPYWLKLFLASTNAVSFVDGFEDNPKEMTEFLTTVVGLRDALEKQTSSTAALPEDTPPHQVLALIQLYLTQLPRPVFGGLMKSAIELGAVTDFFLDPPDSTSGGGALGGPGQD
ncbi:hypothetical protein CAOG_008848 [Capsaspora owczarzaki ATCC 30864]|uniref:Rho-GAP domain-containing protein n=1 Tax=Capsaspora owczarzaki (strain ATCC 30864) TaxID=595528 RepID=A0A0D2VT00_CAPO3|nr:hypothetical protein CAOG_008848 [Capsaspora owczarzaki ATCC 30864]